MRRLKLLFLSCLVVLGSFASVASGPLQQNAVALTIGGAWEKVVTGGDFTCALARGELYCRGINYSGQLGNGTMDSNDYIVHPDLTKVQGLLAGKTVSDFAVGGEHACALAAGEAYCWGMNDSGQLGNGTTTNSAVPVKVIQDTGLLLGKTIQSISTNWNTTCVIASGEPYCWGRNSSGQLGNGTNLDSSVPVKVVQDTGILAGKTVQSVSTGGNHTCAIANSETYCWGQNLTGQLGNGTNLDSSVPVKVVQDTGMLAGKVIQKLSSGWSSTCVVSDGEAYCWGQNSTNQLGNGSTVDSWVPVKVTQDAGVLAGKIIQSISAGDNHACVIASGDAYCWGSNDYGNLGDGTTTNSPVAIKVRRNTGLPAEVTISQISASFWNYSIFTCALADGQLYCWGSNSNGQLGIANESYSVNPIITNFVFASVGTTTNPNLNSGNVDIVKRPTFTGTAQPGSTIVVTVHSDPITCTATADSSGNWSCTLPTDLPPGTHTVQVVVTDTNNNVTTLGPYTVTVATSPAVVSGNINAPDTGAGAVFDMSFVRLLIAMVCVGILGAMGFRLGRR